MKKLITTIMLILLVFTSTSYAQPDTLLTNNAIKDLTKVNNDFNIVITKLTNGNQINKKEIIELLDYNRDILSSTLTTANNAYKKESDPRTRRVYTTILSTASEYTLAINALLLYLDDPTNIEFFMDSIASARAAYVKLYGFENAQKQ